MRRCIELHAELLQFLPDFDFMAVPCMSDHDLCQGERMEGKGWFAMQKYVFGLFVVAIVAIQKGDHHAGIQNDHSGQPCRSSLRYPGR